MLLMLQKKRSFSKNLPFFGGGVSSALTSDDEMTRLQLVMLYTVCLRSARMVESFLIQLLGRMYQNLELES